MARINRNKLSDEEVICLLRQFDATLAKLDRSSTSIFLRELLGREERLMVAKRLAAIVLIREGCSEYRVSQILKLSPSTTGKIARNIETGLYKGIISLLIKKKKNYAALVSTLDSILHLGGILPHRVGLDRYQHR